MLHPDQLSIRDWLSVRAIQIYMMTFARKRLLTKSSDWVSIQRHDEL